MFIYQRDPIDLNTEYDSNIDRIVDIPYDGILDNQIQLVCDELGIQIPSDEKYNNALEFVTSYIERTKVNMKQAKPKYFGVKISCDIVQEVEHAFGDLAPPFWIANRDKIQDWTIQSAHVTIVLRSKKSEHAELFDFYNKRWLESGTPSRNHVLGIGAPVILRASKIVYNNRVCAMIIDSSAPGFVTMNKYRHITLATLKDDVKPAESNVLIEDYFAGKASFIDFPPTEFTGNIAAFFN